MAQVKVLKNPVLQGYLVELRDKSTGRARFRELLERAGEFIAYELANELETEEVEVETVLGKARGYRVREEELVVVGVLRAGLAMQNGVLKVYRNAKAGFVSAARVEDEHAEAKGYRMQVELGYSKVPEGKALILVDPMLATGSTLAKVLREIGSSRFEKVYVLTVISTELGIKRVLEAEPRARIYTLAIDPELNRQAYIVPGLGDAGDRAYG